MAFAQRLDLRQSQQLVMTPQLQQAIKMLQMSNLELRDFIAEELERNPLLETAPSQAGEPSPAPHETDASNAGPEREADAPMEQALADESLSRINEEFDTGADNVFADESFADRRADSLHAGVEAAPIAEGPGGAEAIEAGAWASVGAGGSSRFDDDEFGVEARLTRQETLREALLRQLGESKTSAVTRMIAAYLIENIDPAGYLRIDLDETAQQIGAASAAMRAAVALIQTFEPAGVAARDLTECLRLQLEDRNRFDPAMATLLENLPLVARREFDKLKRLCAVDGDDLLLMLQEIKALDPKPGARFEDELAPTVIPDVFVFENRSGGWNVELNAETMPKLVVNNSYAAEVLRGSAHGPRADSVKEFVTERQQSANWLLKSIEQRARTILRVASEIVRQQDGFFAFGVTGLRPLNLKRVADAIDMHESTVSRVTSNKYIATPRGVFEFKYFFTPAIASTTGGEAYSAEAIRHRIKGLIDDETPDSVLSDDRIVTILRESGVDIARRTVTKYREALGIPSSIQRRKQLSVLTVS